MLVSQALILLKHENYECHEEYKVEIVLSKHQNYEISESQQSGLNAGFSLTKMERK